MSDRLNIFLIILNLLLFCVLSFLVLGNLYHQADLTLLMPLLGIILLFGVIFYESGLWLNRLKEWLNEWFSGVSRAYDRAAIKFRGVDADINFNLSDYDEEMKQVGQFESVEDCIELGFYLSGPGLGD